MEASIRIPGATRRCHHPPPAGPAAAATVDDNAPAAPRRRRRRHFRLGRPARREGAVAAAGSLDSPPPLPYTHPSDCCRCGRNRTRGVASAGGRTKVLTSRSRPPQLSPPLPRSPSPCPPLDAQASARGRLPPSALEEATIAQRAADPDHRHTGGSGPWRALPRRRGATTARPAYCAAHPPVRVCWPHRRTPWGVCDDRPWPPAHRSAVATALREMPDQKRTIS